MKKSVFKPYLMVGVLALAGVMLAATPLTGRAQPGAADAACVAVAERALEQVQIACSDLDRNSVCYGYNQVGATFMEEVPEDLFSEPADRAEVIKLASIQTSPLDELLQTWGIAVMKLQANIPNTLPGQNVVFVLLGDTQVSNGVAPDQAALPSDVKIDVVTTTRARIRSGPSLRANTLLVADVGQTLPADAVDSSGDWLRVVSGGGIPGWINREVIAAVDTRALPVVTEQTRGPMQAFYVTTGLGAPQCNEAPSMLIVQGPQRVRIDLTVNDAIVSIGSTVIFQTIDPNTMQITVVDGTAVVNNLIVPAGFKAFAPIGVNGGQGGQGGPAQTPEPEATGEPEETPAPEATEEPPIRLVGLPQVVGPWRGCAPLTDEDRAALLPLTKLPAGILNYPITVPPQTNAICAPPGFIPPPGPNPSGGATGSGGTTGSGGLNCAGFGLNEMGGLGFTANDSLSWSPVPGATGYRVIISGMTEGGPIGLVLEVGAGVTSISADTSAFAGALSVSYRVEALVNGVVACTSSAAAQLIRTPVPVPTATPIPPTPAPTSTPDFVTSEPPQS